jgi:hypothetical protein
VRSARRKQHATDSLARPSCHARTRRKRKEIVVWPPRERVKMAISTVLRKTRDLVL